MVGSVRDVLEQPGYSGTTTQITYIDDEQIGKSVVIEIRAGYSPANTGVVDSRVARYVQKRTVAVVGEQGIGLTLRVIRRIIVQGARDVVQI